MATKKIKKLSLLRPAKLRVRKSYYTFSKEYPAGNIHLKSIRSSSGRSPRAKLALAVAGFVLLTALSYFTVSLALNISYKEPAVSSQTQQTGKPFIATDSVKALYMPYNKLGDENYIKSFVRQIRRKNCNSVVIDFKTKQGKLAFTSLDNYAIKGKCALYDNDTVRKAIDLFSEYEINIIAGIYCFEDSAVAEAIKSISVKYMDTKVNWLDTEGNGWLNPCSKRSQNYIINIMTELNEMGIKGFILNSAHFPDASNTSGASYPGIRVYKNEHDVLVQFVSAVKNSLPKDCFVLLGQDSLTVSSDKNSLYYGSMTSTKIDGLAVDTYERSKDYVIDKKTDFVSILSLFESLKNQCGKKHFVPVINMEEYSGSYLRHIKKAGYENFILYDENGDY